jgi:hypothetical protein
MASEKKPSRSERMYGKGPKIRAAEDKPAAAKKETPAEEKAEPASKQSAGEEAAEGDGGGGIPMADVHVRESKAMHTRHQQEYSALVRRHAKERDAPAGVDAATPGADAGDAGGAGAAAA